MPVRQKEQGRGTRSLALWLMIILRDKEIGGRLNWAFALTALSRGDFTGEDSLGQPKLSVEGRGYNDGLVGVKPRGRDKRYQRSALSGPSFHHATTAWTGQSTVRICMYSLFDFLIHCMDCAQESTRLLQIIFSTLRPRQQRR